jgi:hypothetical protein
LVAAGDDLAPSISQSVTFCRSDAFMIVAFAAQVAETSRRVLNRTEHYAIRLTNTETGDSIKGWCCRCQNF